MEGCAVPNPMQMNEVMVNNHISRLLSDNWTLLIVFLIVIGLLVLVLSYFVKQTFKTVRDYKSNEKAQEAPKNADEESYDESDDNENAIIDPVSYQEGKKLKFMKNVEDAYKTYNAEKTSYVQSSFSRTNDDVIDQRMAYKKYDRYEYEPDQNAASSVNS